MNDYYCVTKKNHVIIGFSGLGKPAIKDFGTISDGG